MISDSSQHTSMASKSQPIQLSLQNISMIYSGRRGFMDKLMRRTSKDYVAIANISFDIAPNTFVSIIGPSGCGKSTLLNVIAGLTQPSAGSVIIDGKKVTTPGADRGIVFQNYALMPWMTVADNIRFAIETVYPKMRIKEQQRIVQEYIDLVGLRGAEKRHPHELSGGMKQRVSIARALSICPEVLVLDEPTSAVDAEAEAQIFEHFRAMTRDQMAILISHRFSTVRMADQILVLIDGKIAERGTHEELVKAEGRYARLFSLQAAGYR